MIQRGRSYRSAPEWHRQGRRSRIISTTPRVITAATTRIRPRPGRKVLVRQQAKGSHAARKIRRLRMTRVFVVYKRARKDKQAPSSLTGRQFFITGFYVNLQYILVDNPAGRRFYAGVFAEALSTWVKKDWFAKSGAATKPALRHRRPHQDQPTLSPQTRDGAAKA